MKIEPRLKRLAFFVSTCMPYRSPKACPQCYKTQCKCRRDARPAYANRAGFSQGTWSKASKQFLSEHPLCVECQRQGRVVEGKVTDHIIPHRGNAELFWDLENNAQSLCFQCHNRKTGAGY